MKRGDIVKIIRQSKMEAARTGTIIKIEGVNAQVAFPEGHKAWFSQDRLNFVNRAEWPACPICQSKAPATSYDNDFLQMCDAHKHVFPKPGCASTLKSATPDVPATLELGRFLKNQRLFHETSPMDGTLQALVDLIDDGHTELGVWTSLLFMIFSQMFDAGYSPDQIVKAMSDRQTVMFAIAQNENPVS